MKLIDVVIPDPSSFFLIARDKHVYILNYSNINIDFHPRISFDSDGNRHETQTPTVTYEIKLNGENAADLSKLFNSSYKHITQTKETLAYIKNYKFKVKVTAMPRQLFPTYLKDNSLSPQDIKVELCLDEVGFDDFFKSIDISYSKYATSNSDFISRFELMDI